MHRWARALPGALALLATAATATLAAGPPFPDPELDRAVYDMAGVLTDATETSLERTIDAIESRSGVETVVYTQLDPGTTEDENRDRAAALMDQWGIGRSGFDDGVVLMLGMDENLANGRVSLFGGSGFLGAYASEDELQAIVSDQFVPLARTGDLDAATLAALDAVDARITDGGRDRLETLRVANAVLGLVVAPAALLTIVWLAWRHWRRHGDDPDLVDSESVLMAGPPAGMTPAMATVVRNGRADQHTVNTTLAELAGGGRLTFHNLDRVSEVKSDDDPDPMTDPAIQINDDGGSGDLAAPQREAWDVLRRLGGGDGRLTRTSLWKLNDELTPVRRSLEREAVRLGWLVRPPGPSIGRMTAIGAGLALLGGGIGWIGLAVPMSGALLLGGALILGGISTAVFGQAMSQRTQAGAYVDAMLAAYRRTLDRTMAQARSMREVAADPTVAILADTPDKAVVWGLALGLHSEVAAVLARGLEAETQRTGTTAGAYYPAWLSGGGSGGASAASAAGGVSYGSGSVFSGSAMPDIGGMFDALGSVGSSPPSSSSSSGGGFSGGGSSGGGGGSGSF